MTNRTFTAKTYPFKLLGGFFALAAIFFLFIFHDTWPLAVLSIIIAYICGKIPPPRIEIDDSGLRRGHCSSSGSALLSRILKPDTECRWNWIDSVSTTRLGSGSCLTAVHFSEDHLNKEKSRYRLVIESSLFDDYATILRMIKDHAPQAHFDDTTESIVNSKMDVRSAKPLYWGLLIFVVLFAVLYIYLSGKG